jgi:PAS domain S-box-containing protein
MDGLTRYNDDQVEFSVYDGEEASEEALIYSTGSNSLTSSAFERQTKLNLAGGQWTINWKATDKYRPAASRYMSTIVLIFGIFCAAILYLILLSLLRSKEIIAREVEKQTNKLAESERRLQLVFDSAGEGIFGLDLNGNITFANRAAQELLGYTLKEMVGRSQHSLIQHTCANGAPYDEQYSHTFSTINHGLTHNEDEEVFWHKNGTAISVEYTSEPIQDEDDAPIGAVVVFRDIAERKVAEAEIKQANAELEEFAYRTSHDLRSPLVSSITLLGITEKSIHTDDKSKALASLTHAQNSLRKLEELVKDILVLTQTKNESEGEQNIDLRELINGALDKFRYMDHFERLDIQIDLKFSEALIAKKNRVSLIVENLISNAVKYQDLTKDRSRLHLSTYKLDDKFVMVVQDNGIGIPKDQQDNLFKMFKRFHPKTAFGSGLGLYMVQKSIRILGGEIKYEDPGDGTIFKVYIPLA